VLGEQNAYHSTVADEEHQHIIIEHIMDVQNVFINRCRCRTAAHQTDFECAEQQKFVYQYREELQVIEKNTSLSIVQ
jgi:hypothetical protein